MEEHTQETLEEASWRYNPVKKLDGEFIRQAFKEGAKWQAERMYSKEDLRNTYRWGTTVNHGTKEHFNEWFEQFKKK